MRLLSRAAAFLAMASIAAAPSAAAAEKATTAPRGVSPDDTYALRVIGALELSPSDSTIAYTIEQADREEDAYRSVLYLTTAEGGEPRRMSRKGGDDQHPSFSPDGRRLAFLSDRGKGSQIHVASVGSRRARTVTGAAEGVDEFCWSPDGKAFVFTTVDPRDRAGTDPEPRARAAGRGERSERLAPFVITRTQIQRDGDGFLDDRRSHLWVVPANGGEPKRITDGPYDDSQPQWSPDGKWIAFVSNRNSDPDASDDTDIFLVQPDGTGLHRLAANPGPDDSPRWSHRADRLAFFGRLRPNDYYQSAYLMVVPAGGGAPKNLTASLDTWPAADGLLVSSGTLSRTQWSPNDETLFLTLERRGANYLAAIPSDGGNPREIVTGAHVVDFARLSAAGDRLFFTLHDPTHLPEIHTVAADGSGLRQLTHLQDATLAGWKLSTPQKIHARNSDGDSVESWLYPPLDLDPTRMYPLVLYIHGGPQGFDGDYFDTDLENQILPAAGYAVLRVNYRGSTSYGEKFCRSLWGDWHRREFEDLMVSLDEALRLPWLDAERLGIGGWSYGGIMTVWTVGHTDRFKVGVPERFEIDYLSSFGEDMWFPQYLTELGSPLEHADLYRRLSPGTYVSGIKTPLFLIANERDGNCPPSQAMQLYQRLKFLGVKTELVIYPDESHTMGYPSHLVDRLNRLLHWFGSYLK